jgi:hypothetical protein
MTRQLNIRSDKALVAARRLGHRLNQSTTRVVLDALRRLDRKTRKVPAYGDLSKRDRVFADRLLALARAGRSEGDSTASSEHEYLYDQNGAPK